MKLDSEKEEGSTKKQLTLWSEGRPEENGPYLYSMWGQQKWLTQDWEVWRKLDDGLCLSQNHRNK